MSDKAESELHPIYTDDQRAVDDYFASDWFERSEETDDCAPHWLVANITSHVDDESGGSLFAGVAGLAAILCLFAMLMPIGFECLPDSAYVNQQYIPMMLIIQTLTLPPIVAFCFATATPMFWYGSVLARFLMSILATLPGFFVFVCGMSLPFDRFPPSDFIGGVAAVLITYFWTTAFVSVTIQLWTPWTLVHRRESTDPLPPTGMRSMLELTLIAAIGFGIIPLIQTEGAIEGMLFFFGCGILGTMSAVTVMVALLGDHTRNRRGWLIVTVLGAFCMAMILNGITAVQGFGWDVINAELLLIALLSLYGTILICGVIFLCIRWLQMCGWECVNRRKLRSVYAARTIHGRGW